MKSAGNQDSMLAIEIPEPGGPDALVPTRRPKPQPIEGEVLIKVTAAGVNRPDVLQRQGKYPPPPGASDIPGLEVAGTIQSVSSGVEDFKVGDAVCALLAGGGYAEFCTVPAVQCLPIPPSLDTTKAAGIPEAFFTVWTNLFERGNLKRGETLLVHGGASGIGTTAIQLAHARGACVFATAGSDQKCAACEQLGADRAINYRTEDFSSVVKELTKNRGVDVILDMIGGGYFNRNIEILAADGRLVQIAVQEGAKVTLDLFKMMRRRLILTGSTLRQRTPKEKGRIRDALRAEVWPLVESGRVQPIIHATYPLAEAASAHRELESGRHIGKILLTVDSNR